MRLGNSTSRTSWHYTAFGLRIASEIRLSVLELLSDDGKPADVTICEGNFAELLDLEMEVAGGNYIHRVTADDIVIQAVDIAAFHITRGSRIVVDQAPRADSDSVENVLLGAVMGVLLVQRGMLVLHASTVAVEGGSVIFAGKSGAGKSTLSAAMQGMGCRVLTDELCALVRDENGDFWVQPSYPTQRLCAASASYLGIDTSNLKIISGDRLKYGMSTEARFQAKPLPVMALYELVAAREDELAVSSQVGPDRFVTVYNNAYLAYYSGLLGIRTTLFRQCTELAARIPVHRVYRPEDGNSPQILAEQLKRHYLALRR